MAILPMNVKDGSMSSVEYALLYLRFIAKRYIVTFADRLRSFGATPPRALRTCSCPRAASTRTRREAIVKMAWPTTTTTLLAVPRVRAQAAATPSARSIASSRTYSSYRPTVEVRSSSPSIPPLRIHASVVSLNRVRMGKHLPGSLDECISRVQGEQSVRPLFVRSPRVQLASSSGSSSTTTHGTTTARTTPTIWGSLSPLVSL